MRVFNLKRALLVCVLLGAPSAALAGQLDKSDCTYNGIPLHGKVKIVSAFPDIKVRVVNAFADLSVKKVNAFANDCGGWKMFNGALRTRLFHAPSAEPIGTICMIGATRHPDGRAATGQRPIGRRRLQRSQSMIRSAA